AIRLWPATWVRMTPHCQTSTEISLRSEKTLVLENKMEPLWQKLVLIKLDATVASPWGPVRDYVPGSRLLRFTVVDKDEKQAGVTTDWSPIAGTTCGPDGAALVPSKSGLLSSAALYGALIGKVGGSSADVPDSSSPISPYGTKIV